MKGLRYVRWILLMTLLFSVLPVSYAQSGKTAQSGKAAKKKEYTFHGKVEKINANAKTVTVNGDAVPGWMAAMTMDYAVDKPDTLKKLKAGDEITAKVYEGDTKTLYDVKVMPPKKTSVSKAPTKK